MEQLGTDVESELWEGQPLTVFLDKWDIDVGENIVLKLNAALASARFVAVVMSPEMIGSDWCAAEVSSVLAVDPTNRTGRLIPIRLRDFSIDETMRLEIPPLLTPLNYLDFRKVGAYKKELARLLARLRGQAPPRGARRRRARPSVDSTLVGAIPAARVEPDPIPETLLSNLLVVREVPGTIWSAATTLRRKSELPNGVTFPPFLLRSGRLYSFSDLARPGALSALIDSSTVSRDTAADWKEDAERWRWFIALLNQGLRRHLNERGVAYDRDHDRFYFKADGYRRVQVTWGTGTTRTVVRPPDRGKKGAWVHQGARLRFETVGSRLFLSIDPLWVFTQDGHRPVDRSLVGPLAMQWSGKERNGAVLRHVLMWSDFLTAGRKQASIALGAQQAVITRLPATVRSPVGLPHDQVTVRSLLRFTQTELSLDVPKLVREFAVSTAEMEKPGDTETEERGGE